ncbi:hypothetical protein DIE22_26170 [Burkholderia sp. Bp9142]|nr:hypothetical protein DIE22_26170 [Burkholderia sp. Bp9142]
MGSLHVHVEVLFDNPGLAVVRTSTVSQKSPVSMLVRLDQVLVVLSMLGVLPVPEDTAHRSTGKCSKKRGAQ